MSDINKTRPITEVVDPQSTMALYQEALVECTSTESEIVKTYLQERILEVRRLEDCLAKAKDKLNELLAKEPREIAALASGMKPGSFFPFTKEEMKQLRQSR